MAFGPFRLLPAHQLLLEGELPVRLGSRALEILTTLVERAGQLVSKDELIARVWPDTVVEEANLRVHVAALRRALGDGQMGKRYIANVPGRGYRFVGPVLLPEPLPGSGQSARPDRIGDDLPTALVRMIGRDDVVAALESQLRNKRFLTIVGPGGIGKSTVAIAVADRLRQSFPDAVHVVDLAPITNPKMVASGVAAALGLAIRSEEPLPGLIAFLKTERVLLVLDSCEHVIEAVAALSDALIRGTTELRILATSREPLRAKGERVVRLSALALPADVSALTAAEALTYPAIQLFVERASASLDTFELKDDEAAVVASICTMLDGVPLAIELAAGRIDAFGVRGVSERLNDRFSLLTRGRRTALPRHRTLQATLDWSYDQLSDFERLILRRLGVFAGWFTSASASAVVREVAHDDDDLVEGIADLFAKSLLAADTAGPTTRYRLSESTRAYAVLKMREAGEFESAKRAHAGYLRALFERAERDWTTRPTFDWLSAYGNHLDDLRAALEWEFSPAGDADVGIAITVAAIPLWFELSLMEECRARVEQALTIHRLQAITDPRRAMQLHAALAWSQMYTTGAARAADDAWSTALALSEDLADTDFHLRSLWGLWAGSMNRGEFSGALALAERFCGLAEKAADPADRQVGDRLKGASLHLLGDQSEARRHIERMLASYVTPKHRSHIVRFQFDQQVTARYTLQRILWLQGLPDRALLDVRSNVEHARSINHTLSFCNTLAQAACPVALFCGDLEAAQRYITLLMEQTARDALDVWRCYGDCYEGELLIRTGDPVSGLTLMHAGVNKLRQAQFVQYLTTFLGILAEHLVAADRTSEATIAIEEALARTARTDERWSTPELLRIQGVVALAEKDADTAAACFRRSLDLAHRQGALAWELRTAMSLCRMQMSQGVEGDGGVILQSTFGRFTEGHGTADLVAAKALIHELP